MSLFAILAGAITGIVLGLLGSGGSIVTTPALLYLLHLEPKAAIAMSLGIVAITAAIAAIHHWRLGNIDFRIAAVFGLFGIVGAHFGARAGLYAPVVVQLGLFAAFAYFAAFRMLRKKSVAAAAEEEPGARPSPDIRHIGGHGLLIGGFTGLVGVGGGALVIPTLVLWSRLSLRRAVGTSLVIVAANAAAAFASYLGTVTLNYTLMGSFTAVTVAGSFLGAHVAKRISTAALTRVFAVFLMALASYIIIKSVLLR